ncbi:MAG: DNA polymerase IV [Candidatus Omnitrophota bacterium]
MLLHIDMDAFFASIEQQINPALRGKPVIVGSRDKKYKTVVAAASYEAKDYGIRSGMLSHEALKICPHAEFVACDSAKYTFVSRGILELLEEFSPFVEHSTIDEFDLEIAGLEPFFGPPLELGKTIKNRIKEAFGLTCSIGIAPTWILAKLGTKIRKPDGLIVIDESNLDSIIQGLAVEKICGIGPALTAHLAALGILTCEQLKNISEEILVNNFGRSTGHWLYAILRTDENVTHQKGETDKSALPKTIGHSYTLPGETCHKETIFSWLRMLSEMVAERSRKTGVSGKTVCLWINSRNESFIRQKTYCLPTNDGREIFSRARAIFDQKKAIFGPVRALGVTLSGLIFEATPLLFYEQKRREDLLIASDMINARYGDWTILPAALAHIHTK